MSMSNSEARKRAVENAVQAMKAEVWDEGRAAEQEWRSKRSYYEAGVVAAPPLPANPYRSEAGR